MDKPPNNRRLLPLLSKINRVIEMEACSNVNQSFVTQIQPFSTGDRVIVNGQLGTIITIFPDGIHMVKLDKTGKVIAVTASQLEPAGPREGTRRKAGLAA